MDKVGNKSVFKNKLYY